MRKPPFLSAFECSTEMIVNEEDAMNRPHRVWIALAIACTVAILLYAANPAADVTSWSDFHSQRPGTFHKITAADLPQPFATEATRNTARLVPRPANAWPQAPQGFEVGQYFTG